MESQNKPTFKGHLIFEKSVKTNNWRMEIFSKNSAGTTVHLYLNKLISTYTSHHIHILT